MAGTCSTVEPAGAGEIMLFGVRVVVDSMRKSVSLNNLSQYEQPQEGSNNNSGNNTIAGKDDVAGYASENDVVHNSAGNRERERKRGVPWTEEEHKLFLLGLQKVGKGDWRGISRNFVKTRTPTQVASHAQKYFLRRSNHNRRRRRSSLFDITTDTVTATPMDEEQVHHQNNTSQSHPLPPPPPSEACNPSGFSMVPNFPLTVGPAVLPVPIENPMGNLTLGHTNLENNASAKLVRPIALHSAPHAAAMSDLNLKSTMDTSTLTLNLSLTMDPRESSSRHSAFQAMPSFSNGDSIISVA
ncbi:unnamed protein product [Prunus armeniaca]|uniref:Uncharacterized protein n=1 Tax=Prunus armeniaca TaxID=36596 RepID=A0A6J5V4C7_PRUAR|nr:unnamed protein product [Prunus armeniaca]